MIDSFFTSILHFFELRLPFFGNIPIYVLYLGVMALPFLIRMFKKIFFMEEE